MLKKVIAIMLTVAATTSGLMFNFSNAAQAKEKSTATITSKAKISSTVSNSDYYQAWKTYTVQYPTLEKGDNNNNVKILQKELNKVHNNYGIGKSLTADGNFGPETESMVETVQGYTGKLLDGDKLSALTKDGIAGSYTWGKIIMMVEQ